tara:strand:+ start:796 stop:1218 length:423 start_codon:yes stop_codon:yes gene_type:complete
VQNAVRREEKIYAVESAPLCLPRVVIVVLDGAFRASNGGDDDGCDDDIVVGGGGGTNDFYFGIFPTGIRVRRGGAEGISSSGANKTSQTTIIRRRGRREKTYARARVDKRRRRSHGRVEHESAFRTRTPHRCGEIRMHEL